MKMPQELVLLTLFLTIVSKEVSSISHNTRSLSSNFELPVDESLQSFRSPRIDVRPDIDQTQPQAKFEESLAPFTLNHGLKNVSKETGSQVIFKCEFRGNPNITVEWFQNEAPVEVVKGKREILPSKVSNSKVISRLKISNLEVLDKAFYKCQGSYQGFVLDSTAILQVSQGSTYISSESLPEFNPEIDPEFPGSFSAK
jgi:hypothetical protein